MTRFSRLRIATWLVLAAPVAATAAPCAGFTDVDDGSGFCASIAWMKNRAITLGCTSTLYCPDDFVRRDQLAAFMYRLGVQNAFLNGGNGFGTTAVLGTTDNQALDVRANGSRVMRYEPDAISPNAIGGSPDNRATPGIRGATIGGGGVPESYLLSGANVVASNFGTVSGGYGNRAGNDGAPPADATFATVGGGDGNSAVGTWSTVGGGRYNHASHYGSTIAGGYNNSASLGATVGGGLGNTANDFGVVGGGGGNFAYSYGVVAGGTRNLASGPYASVPGGDDNQATGAYSLAMGRHARTGGTGFDSHAGAFVFSDSNDVEFSSTGANEFAARATGGVRFVTAVDGLGISTWTCGVSGGAGGSWGCSSDRNLKSDLVPFDGVTALDRLANLPVYRWVAKDDARRIPHAGPTSQDFMAAFGLGDNDTMIGFGDAQGVLFAAVQELNARHRAERAAKDAEIAALRSDTLATRLEMADLRAAHQKELADLRLAVEVLMARKSAEARPGTLEAVSAR